MLKFNKLSREEMKQVTGGYIQACLMTCSVLINLPDANHPDGTYYNAYSYVADCSNSGTAQCTNGGGMVKACRCDVVI